MLFLIGALAALPLISAIAVNPRAVFNDINPIPGRDVIIKRAPGYDNPRYDKNTNAHPHKAPGNAYSDIGYNAHIWPPAPDPTHATPLSISTPESSSTESLSASSSSSSVSSSANFTTSSLSSSSSLISSTIFSNLTSTATSSSSSSSIATSSSSNTTSSSSAATTSSSSTETSSSSSTATSSSLSTVTSSSISSSVSISSSTLTSSTSSSSISSTSTVSSATVTYTAIVLQVYAADGSFFGYISNSFNQFGECTTTSNVSSALHVTFEVPPGALTSQIDLISVDGSGFSDIPRIGGIVGFSSANDNFATGSYSYAYLGPTIATTPGSPPTSGDNAFTRTTEIAKDVESAIWTVDLTTNALTPQWINTDGSSPKTFVVDEQGITVLTGDPDVFQNSFGAGTPLDLFLLQVTRS